MDIYRMLICIGLMAGITYLIRVLPITLFQRKVRSRFVKSFLYYVPYAVLAALTFPSIFYATGDERASVVGTLAALVLAFFDLGLVVVAIGAVAAALVCLLV